MFGLILASMPFSTVRAGEIVAEPGDLIRGTSFSAVYYMGEDGFRYVFPNDKTYFTWYENFDTVIMLSDADLAKVQMGGNVTYRPWSKMIKINSDPKTYQVSTGGELRWITSEEVAIELYGANWNTKIDDVPDGFFGNYTIGAPIERSEDVGESICFDEGEPCTYTITDDKELTAYATMTIDDMEYNGAMESDGVVEIYAGQTVLFRNSDDVKHTATATDESWGTGTLNSGDTFVKRFDEVGTYYFYCSYHPEMSGYIVVNEGLTM